MAIIQSPGHRVEPTNVPAWFAVPTRLMNPETWEALRHSLGEPMASSVTDPSPMLSFVGNVVPGLFVAHETGNYTLLMEMLSDAVVLQQSRMPANPYAGWQAVGVDVEVISMSLQAESLALSLKVTTHAQGPGGEQGSDSERWDATADLYVYSTATTCGGCGAPMEPNSGPCRFCKTPPEGDRYADLSRLVVEQISPA